MTLDDDQLVALGRAVVEDGRLEQLRARLGFSVNAMADLLYVAPGTYRQWVRNPNTRLWLNTARTIGLTYATAMKTLAEVRAEGVNIDVMVPFHQVSMELGIAQEVLMKWFREQDLEGFDLGIFGMWMEADEMERLKLSGARHVAA